MHMLKIQYLMESNILPPPQTKLPKTSIIFASAFAADILADNDNKTALMFCACVNTH